MIGIPGSEIERGQFNQKLLLFRRQIELCLYPEEATRQFAENQISKVKEFRKWLLEKINS